MNIKILTVLATTVFGFGAHAVSEAAQAPNFYDCSGKNVSLTLAIGSKAQVGIVAPHTVLNLQVGAKNYSFQEADITTESTLIGDLWEVTLNHIPDLYIDHASVVIPSVSLGNSPLNFKSQLVLTRVNTPFIPTPFEGVVNPSKYIDLSCSASMVYY
ncbi:MAG: hypothetical protein HOO92_15575 [Methylococcaceae bacterium]|nr:hypothetical protein [Methylococcaceae bacterium]